jgi:AcrR family transcriptional regulator
VARTKRDVRTAVGTLPARSRSRDGGSERDATRTRILEAALECFGQLGIAKTNLQDVARAAGISRGTVYRYFPERRALIDAAIEHRAESYYALAATRMAAQKTLAGQLGALGEVFAESVTGIQDHRLGPDDMALMRLSGEDRAGALGRMARFLVPYIQTAKSRGEVRTNIDVREASEWVARVLMSITTTPASSAFDVHDPKSVSRFMRRYAVNGLAS